MIEKEDGFNAGYRRIKRYEDAGITTEDLDYPYSHDSKKMMDDKPSLTTTASNILKLVSEIEKGQLELCHSLFGQPVKNTDALPKSSDDNSLTAILKCVHLKLMTLEQSYNIILNKL